MFVGDEVALGVPLVECVVNLGAFTRDRDLVFLDVHDHLREQGAEQVFSHVVRYPVEQFDRVREHVDMGQHQLDAVVKAFLGVRELLLDRALLKRDLLETLA
ncbi:MAG TPA: hypothetical protein DHW40_11685 [Microbacterium sp.]|nr:hypothetical protein [Microbacterium sp.]